MGKLHEIPINLHVSSILVGAPPFLHHHHVCVCGGIPQTGGAEAAQEKTRFPTASAEGDGHSSKGTVRFFLTLAVFR